MNEMVYVSERRLVGEVISLKGDAAVVEVFEDVSMLRAGDPVFPSGRPLSCRLGPGIIGGVFDGIQRPLTAIESAYGPFIPVGARAASLDEGRKWAFEPLAKPGDILTQGQFVGQVPETPALTHKIMLPIGVNGVLQSVAKPGEYSILDTIAVIRDDEGGVHNITMAQDFPTRRPRPVKRLRSADRPLVTGQRVIDTLFPIAKGGMAALPGGFGTGKTMTQHQIAKWSDADVIVYVGCGERGNEMTQVLEEFGGLTDPRTGSRLLDRTVLIANTSNMPVAAREASIFTGLAISEYYRDMGLHVAVMADSTSRWAEALRENSGRLEEMPAEEGFPAYLASRLASFYERAGYVDTLSGLEGSVTIIGAVSPQGADFSEPVTQNTKRFTRCFLALDRALAYSRHYPAIHWMKSYSEYSDTLDGWYIEHLGKRFPELRAAMMRTLNEESRLMDIVKLVGADVLPDGQKLTLEIARVIRLGFAQQNAYHAYDSYVPMEKQFRMMEVIFHLYDVCKPLLERVPLDKLVESGIFERVIGMKYEVGNGQSEKFDGYIEEIDTFAKKVYNGKL
ncbi:MAG: V-type ATP synthase subunit A, partial [Clostridiales bacterium]|jgi:V/A-type H+-transporting ATPase subunit A|nr:V-type ATP synthase subunit A [Clostridiales bacterium]